MNKMSYKQPVELMVQAASALNIEDEKVYGNFLAQTYYYVYHSTRLLAFSAGLMGVEEETHFKRFIKHISEEYGHDRLAVKDLEDLGMKTQDFLQLPETRALWETQYYKILHEGPMSLMGYIIALEYFAVAYLPTMLKRVDACYGGIKARRFIKVHAEEDIDHIDKAIAVMESLTPQQQETVIINIIQTAKMYSSMLTACETYSHVQTTDQLTNSFIQQ